MTWQLGRAGAGLLPPAHHPQQVWTSGPRVQLAWTAPSPSQVPRGYNYRVEVRKLVPQLQVLDEVPATHTNPPASRKLDQDWLMVKDAIKEGRVLDSLLPRLGTAVLAWPLRGAPGVAGPPPPMPPSDGQCM